MLSSVSTNTKADPTVDQKFRQKWIIVAGGLQDNIVSIELERPARPAGMVQQSSLRHYHTFG
jgi:hypothetical protein